MIKLKNIKMENDIASCDVFLEDCEEAGFLKVDVKQKKVIECILPEEYSNHPMGYKGYAIASLYKACENKDNVPNEKLIMWY